MGSYIYYIEVYRAEVTVYEIVKVHVYAAAMCIDSQAACRYC